MCAKDAFCCRRTDRLLGRSLYAGLPRFEHCKQLAGVLETFLRLEVDTLHDNAIELRIDLHIPVARLVRHLPLFDVLTPSEIRIDMERKFIRQEKIHRHAERKDIRRWRIAVALAPERLRRLERQRARRRRKERKRIDLLREAEVAQAGA